jgi:amino acid transporter
MSGSDVGQADGPGVPTAQNGGENRGHGFGTAPVFLTSICAILGAIMFLRFGYAVGNLGLISAIALVIIGHLITIPTGLAISEIATNLRVGGGGEYFIISRSFGIRIGASIGIMLFLAQGISVAFYIIGFTEGMGPMIPWFQANVLDRLPGSPGFDPRMISLPIAICLFSMIMFKGADVGIKVLWGIFGLLAASIVVFMVSGPLPGTDNPGLTTKVPGADSFATVFAICFPAFTGMTAGVGLSGDLKKPGKSIPRGIIAATTLGLVVYLAIVTKLYFSAPVSELATDYLIMYRIAFFGPLILLGIMSATLSSALGFALISPRTAQAMGEDRVMVGERASNFFKEGQGTANDPTNGTFIVGVISIFILFLGNLNAVAQIITMFFLIIYGSTCLISFMEHFAGNPAYRPTFRTKWYLSLIGALFCFAMMFVLSVMYATIAIIIMVALYLQLGRSHGDSQSMAVIFQGVMFQVSRRIKLKLQETHSRLDKYNWRPSVLALSLGDHDRMQQKQLLKWLSHHYGFGTYVHHIKGNLDDGLVQSAKEVQEELVDEAVQMGASYSVQTLIAPTFPAGVAQSVQLSNPFGIDNNTVLFEYSGMSRERLKSIIASCELVSNLHFNLLVLRSSERNFGHRKDLHIWMTDEDLNVVNLMIILAFIITQHADWRGAEPTLFIARMQTGTDEQSEMIMNLMDEDRLPIAKNNVKTIYYSSNQTLREVIHEHSASADLTLIGFEMEALASKGQALFSEYKELGDVLFVSAGQEIVIR